MVPDLWDLFKRDKIRAAIHIYIQVARVPRLIQLEFGDECERKRAWREVGMEVGEGDGQGGGEGIGKGDEDG